MDINAALNEAFVKIFRNILTIEEKAIRSDQYQHVTMNDMHVMEAIGDGAPKNMTSIAKRLGVTTGTLTIAVNGLVKKGFVERVRSEEDRRVVLVSLTESGKKLFIQHMQYHKKLTGELVDQLNDEEKVILEKVLHNLSRYMTEAEKQL